MLQSSRIAFVYDWFDTSFGGAERVLQTLHKAYPQAPWFTSHVDIQSTPWAQGWDVRTSFLQKFPVWFRRNRIVSLLLIPLAFESLDFSEFDAVISISSAFAKGIITKTQTKHICYLLTPPRWLWHSPPISKNSLLHLVEKQIRAYLQHWDYIAAQRVDTFISISHEVASRCRSFYTRETDVLYPPFDVAYWQDLVSQNAKKEQSICSAYDLKPNNYFLVVSRLEPYKHIDLAIRAFRLFKANDMYKGQQLVIVGNGSQKEHLQRLCEQFGLASELVWLQSISDAELVWLYSNTSAFIMPQQEDFGYVACEASICGAPIVAFRVGGQKEILDDYPKVVYFDEHSPASLVAALEKTASFEYNAKTYENRHIRGWGRDSFVAALAQKIPQTV